MKQHWEHQELGDVAGNRDAAFPPLHDDMDMGVFETRFMVVVPFMVNGARFRDLLDSLKRWVEDQGLADFLPEEDTGITYMAMHASKTREDDEAGR